MKALFYFFFALFQLTLLPASEWIELFNQKDFDGWYGRNPHRFVKVKEGQKKAFIEQEQKDLLKHWKVADEVIYNDGHGPYLTTKKEYGDIDLQLEVKMEKGSDSGIYLRGSPQVQLWDTKDESKWKHGAKLGSGGLWNNKVHTEGRDPIVHGDNPIGEWNKVRVLQVGARTSVWVNDKLVVDHVIMDNYWNYKMPLAKSGPIMLQTHGAPVYWRNIKVKELSTDESVQILAEKSNESSWKEITPNTTNHANWTSTTNKPFELVEGVVRGGEGSYYYSEKQFGDYQMAFKFKLRAGANNGLLVRYPGKGDGAYAGLCELQILDNTHPKYAKLDDRQYHGSAYGMQAAHKNALNEVGEWNHQIVTVKGRKIVVELNGYEILNVDLTKVKDFMGNKPHQGFDRDKGYVGFAGHRQPFVDFKDIRIRELK
jgi:hypothetical protein